MRQQHNPIRLRHRRPQPRWATRGPVSLSTVIGVTCSAVWACAVALLGRALEAPTPAILLVAIGVPVLVTLAWMLD